MFGDPIIYNAQRQVTLNLKQFKHSRYYASSGYLQDLVLKRSEQKLQRKQGVKLYFPDAQGQLTP